MKAISFLLLGFFLLAAESHGKVYTWTDEKGVKNFTDSIKKVPLKYRKQVKELEVETEGKTPAPPATEPAATEARPAPSPGVPSLIAGRDEAGWRSAFGIQNSEIGRLVKGLAEKREKLALHQRRRNLYHKASDRVAVNALKAEIAEDEAALNAARERLLALETEANRLDVPKEWRDYPVGKR